MVGRLASSLMFRLSGDSAVECATHNRESLGSNPTMLPFRSLGTFVVSTMPQVTQLYIMST